MFALGDGKLGGKLQERKTGKRKRYAYTCDPFSLALLYASNLFSRRDGQTKEEDKNRGLQKGEGDRAP